MLAFVAMYLCASCTSRIENTESITGLILDELKFSWWVLQKSEQRRVLYSFERLSSVVPLIWARLANSIPRIGPSTFILVHFEYSTCKIQPKFQTKSFYAAQKSIQNYNTISIERFHVALPVTASDAVQNKINWFWRDFIGPLYLFVIYSTIGAQPLSRWAFFIVSSSCSDTFDTCIRLSKEKYVYCQYFLSKCQKITFLRRCHKNTLTIWRTDNLTCSASKLNCSCANSWARSMNQYSRLLHDHNK